MPNRKELELDNKIVYNICDKKDYIRAVITYISGMTDNYAIETYYNICLLYTSIMHKNAHKKTDNTAYKKENDF